MSTHTLLSSFCYAAYLFLLPRVGQWCFVLHLPRKVSLLFGAKNELERDTWVDAINTGIKYNAAAEREAAKQKAKEIEKEEERKRRASAIAATDGATDGVEEQKGDELGDSMRTLGEVVEVRGAGIAKYVRPSVNEGTKKTGSPVSRLPRENTIYRADFFSHAICLVYHAQMDDDSVTSVICETIEGEIEREATTEDDAVALLQQHLGHYDGNQNPEALNRAIGFWCQRFDIEVPSKESDPGLDRLAVIAKWVFWVIQARTILRARFDKNPEDVTQGEEAGVDGEEALETMVLEEWAEELDVGLDDLKEIYMDLERCVEQRDAYTHRVCHTPV